MKVILLKPVRKLGKIGDIVEVKPGFGRNFLVPEGFAVRATEANEKIISEQKKELEAKNADAKKHAEGISAKISGKDFTFIRQSAADGRLFGSVANKEIAKVLTDAGYEVSYANIHLDKPIKNLGVYEVTLILHSDVVTSIIINVARSDSESIDALRAFKNPISASEKTEEEVVTIDEESDNTAA